MSKYEIIYTYEPPRPAPSTGSSWDSSLDYPGVRLTVSLAANAGRILGELVSDAIVLGESLNSQWGNAKYDSHQPFSPVYRRESYRIFYGPTLAQAEQEARSVGDAAEATLSAVIEARETRLRQRDSTIARAHQKTISVQPPGLES